MSAGTNQARAEFAKAMQDSHNLVRIHKDKNRKRGRRWDETTLNRSVVVLAVASWQAFVEGTTRAILSELAVPPSHNGHALYLLINAATATALGRFNTPSAQNSLSLFTTVGFDPTPGWSFTIGQPARRYAEPRVRKEIDEWLRVRHAVAHGFQLPALSLVTGRTKTGPSLHRNDAESCIEFFEALTNATADEVHRQFP